MLSTLLNPFKLVYGPFGQSNMHSTLDFCPRLARKPKVTRKFSSNCEETRKETNVLIHTTNEKLRNYCPKIYNNLLWYKLFGEKKRIPHDDSSRGLSNRGVLDGRDHQSQRRFRATNQYLNYPRLFQFRMKEMYEVVQTGLAISEDTK